jgi:hypothetical protein
VSVEGGAGADGACGSVGGREGEALQPASTIAINKHAAAVDFIFQVLWVPPRAQREQWARV